MSEDPQEPVTVQALIKELWTSATSEDCDAAAHQLADIIKKQGIASLKVHGVLESLANGAKNKKSGLEREGALIGFNALAEVLGHQSEPILLPYVPIILDLYADKGSVVQETAELAATNIVKDIPAEAYKALLPVIYEGLGVNGSKKWQTKVGALKMLTRLGEIAPTQIALSLPELIPIVSDYGLTDTKSEVEKAANETMMKICSVGGNADIQKHMKDLVNCMAHPSIVTQTIAKLSATTFVAEVDGPCLAVMVPLLVRALNERSTLTLRQTVVVIDNLCKLVKDPKTAAQFLPSLYPGVDHQAEQAAFPEIRALATAARRTLVNAGGGVKSDGTTVEETVDDNITPSEEEALKIVKQKINKAQNFIDSFFNPVINYISLMTIELVRQEVFSQKTWSQLLMPYLRSFLLEKDAATVCHDIHHHYHELDSARNSDDDGFDDMEGEELCNIDFSLAYGGMMLLNHTKLRLHRGQRYGLCGQNGAGKSTLMRAISQGKLEGFPSQDQLRTVYVEHALQGEDTTVPILNFVCSDPKLAGVTEEEVAEGLRKVGFTDERQQEQVGSLSGGWKMKLELARAMLMKADILLLDEPTNHLDVTNVEWLANYLINEKNVTSVIVSHDSGFLDKVCSNILHYEKKKLRLYPGNLTAFVAARPEAKSYFTLAATSVKFQFPKPSVLTGVRSNTKAILKMTDCTYTYPGAPRPSLKKASVSLSLGSRVAVLGANGAGKSTMIKLLTGEMTPQEGTIWRHPNLRIGYVAQHAFHHLEQHLEKTPYEYLMWRYQGGEDREVLEKETRIWSEEEQKQMDTYVNINGESRQVEFIIGRSKLKKTFQYEIKWRNLRHKNNTWMPRDKLIELGFGKLVQQFDDKEASREGLAYRDLTSLAIREHFEDVGLASDIAMYNKIEQLSGGQKVKVVIGAAMWNNSHMLVLDEPTNFLDREALGGMAVAIRVWEGAVVMVSHSTEFVGALCPEHWQIEAGELTKLGKSAIVEDSVQIDEEKIRAKNKKKKKMTRNDVKEQQIRRRQRHLKWLAEGGEKEGDTDSD
ncbi:P-loop containing nucleoside triphosphate hydrolase protein [Umbelopsis sp. AD052]|nr:P-loop containing nucleoside triphosphate hydrolase protein [Umbelopsis sp. AD052]